MESTAEYNAQKIALQQKIATKNISLLCYKVLWMQIINLLLSKLEEQSNGGKFAASMLYQLLEDSKFNVPDAQYLPNSLIKVPNVLIGDEAYPLKTYLMRPYPQNNLTPDKSAFNYKTVKS
jgi:hypothetical protein